MIRPRDKLALAAPMLLLALYLLWVAATLQVETFDTYEILLNARTFAGDPFSNYYASRAFAFPIFLSPIFLLARLVSSDPPTFGLVACHLVSIALSCTFIYTTYRLLRLHLRHLPSAIGAGLLFFNPLIVHTAPISKEDQPGALVTVAAIFFYVRLGQTGRRKHLVLASFFTFLTMATRYNLLPLLPLTYLAYELITRWPKITVRDTVERGLALAVLPALAWLVVPTIFYPLIGRAPLGSATAKFLTEIYRATTGATGSEMPYAEPATEALWFLWRALGPTVVAFAAWGFFFAWRKKQPGRLIHSCWLVIFLAFHALFLGHKEARYLFPFFVPIYFFAAVGIESALRQLGSPWAKAAMLLVVLALPLWRGIDEGRKFLDPFYHENFARDVARRAAGFSANKPIVWLGPFYAMHPAEYVFDERDAVTYLYHLFAHTIRYYASRQTIQTTKKLSVYIPGNDPANGVFPDPKMAYGLLEGQGMILNLEPAPYVTQNVPARLKPLVVERARALEFSAGPSPSTQKTIRLHAVSPADTVLQISNGGANDVAVSISAGEALARSWLVFAATASSKIIYLGVIDSTHADRSAHFDRSKFAGDGLPVAYRLVSFDSVTLMRQAGM